LPQLGADQFNVSEVPPSTIVKFVGGQIDKGSGAGVTGE
jgi:hypothetical protein